MKFYRSKLLKVPHGIFNRFHGTSPLPYNSLNVSYGVGDKPNNVNSNRRRIKEALGITYILSAKQVHQDKIYNAVKITRDMEIDGYDALITDQQGIGLLIQQADCQAILMHDPVRKVIAAIHCGWRGSVANISGSTIKIMQQKYLIDPGDLQVAISPSLGPCCAEFVNFRSELPRELHQFQERTNHFNFWEISVSQLRDAGVAPGNIDVAGICTCCNRNYFSYRRSMKKGKNQTGRNGSVICLP